MRQICLLLTLLVLVLAGNVLAGTEIVRFVDATSLKNNPNNRYFIKALDLALRKSEKQYGDYFLKAIDIPITQQRHFVELALGRIDVFWTMASPLRENFARAVPVPLAFGSYGIRLLAINKASQSFFAGVTNQVELSEFIALTGQDWPDTIILRESGLRLDDSHSEHDFYTLLQGNPQYYYPRGVTEIYSELSGPNGVGVEVEPNLAFVYPTVMYFYVANDNKLLANRLEAGLKAALADGSLEALFLSFPEHSEAFKQAQLHKRQLIKLVNNNLPKGVVASDIEKLQQKLINTVSDRQ
ncbi:hypothetical protein ACFOEE_03425 [Pseudoalteromonas fenneropenaei]|uniref:Solute-binding protein family 3/N-terminal domain-containing protein n=1 Tax=Pseudoalteromonas fenneropenaei TaxID=1737459 RepID=A0ABV7CG69_9GAMM